MHIALYLTSLIHAAPFWHSQASLPICTPASATYLPVGSELLHWLSPCKFPKSKVNGNADKNSREGEVFNTPCQLILVLLFLFSNQRLLFPPSDNQEGIRGKKQDSHLVSEKQPSALKCRLVAGLDKNMLRRGWKLVCWQLEVTDNQTGPSPTRNWHQRGGMRPHTLIRGGRSGGEHGERGEWMCKGVN